MLPGMGAHKKKKKTCLRAWAHRSPLVAALVTLSRNDIWTNLRTQLIHVLPARHFSAPLHPLSCSISPCDEWLDHPCKCGDAPRHIMCLGAPPHLHG